MTSTELLSKKRALLDKMVRHPKEFADEHFKELVSIPGDDAVNFDDLRNNIRRIYDMNESSLLEESDAMKGSLAKLNRKKQEKRRKKFFNRIKAGKRTTDYKTIVAEGDSWFCFPVYVKDINQWLIDDDRINLFSIAAAGDWIANMIFEGKYIEELSMIEPDVFLISGGGNDFCGSYRLAYMINTNVDENLPDDKYIEACISPAFDAFIWTLKTQYYLIFSSLQQADKLKAMKIITQGYDYVIPYPKKIRSGNIMQILINYFTATGDWLRGPLELKGLHDAEKQKRVMAHFIDKVNDMFKWLVNYPAEDTATGTNKFPNLYHVDCRGTARNFNDWFDEIHLKSDRFKAIANAYKHIIFDNPEQRVIKVAEK